MKKIKNIVLTLVSIFVLLLPSFAAGSEEVRSVDITATINSDGSMDVVEEWTLNAENNYDQYIYKFNMDYMDMSDISLSVKGREFERYEDPAKYFDIPQEEKKQVYTIQDIANDVMIIFNDSEDGMNEYSLEYTINNSVLSFTDGDAFYYPFVYKLVSKPQKVSVRIDVAGGKLSEENADAWAFGYEEPMYFQGGDFITKVSDMSGSDELHVFAQLEDGLVNPSYEGTGSKEDFINSLGIGGFLTEDARVRDKTADDSFGEFSTSLRSRINEFLENHDRFFE